ncbi:MAG: glycoside hydrolase family 43 protein [Pseudoxanthomonas sp.]
MKRWVRLLAVCICLCAGPAWAGSVRFTEVAYAGDDDGPPIDATQYRNPVIAGFHPDPSAIRVGDDFYLVNSSFGYFPGLPIFHSRDLVSWRQIGNAIDRAGQIDYGNDEITRGLFAPAISFHDGLFYIANTCFYCDGGNFIITAKDPAGPWSDPVWLGFTGIDPSLFFDDDGTAWIVNNDIPQGEMRYDGHRAIWIQRFDIAAQRMVGARKVLVDGGANPATRPEHVEGPHLFKHDGYYYLTAAEGGTGEKHAQMIWRSRQATGPFIAWPGNPVLTQRDLDPARPDPVTSAGHAQFIELEDGSWWAVFLATRPYRANQYNLGRETFLLPVAWTEGWPVILPRGARVPIAPERPALPRDRPVANTGPFEWSEKFTTGKLPAQWMTIHPPKRSWFTAGPGGLDILPSSTPLGASGKDGQAAYVAHRLQHHRATLATTLAPFNPAPGELAGLALLQNETHFYILGVEHDQGGTVVSLYRRAGEAEPETGKRLLRAALPSTQQSVSLRFELDGPSMDVSYATTPGEWKTLATGLDASLLSVDIAGGFIGNTFGPYAYRP